MSIITITTILIMSAIFLYRVLYFSGVPLPTNGLFGKLTAVKRIDSSDNTVTKNEIIRVALSALAVRLILYFLSYLILVLVYMIDDSFLNWWFKWDATNYVGIATGGYDYILIDGIENMSDKVLSTLVFFPLYPAIIKLVSYIIPDFRLAALITSTLCYVGGCIFLYMAAALRYGKSIAKKAVILITVFPYAFFFGTMTPESTFLLVGSACIYFTIKRKWWIAGLFGILCSLSRMQGIIIIAFVGIEWIEDCKPFYLIRQKEWKNLFKNLVNIIPVLFPFIGLVLYFLINFLYTKDAFYFLKLQENVWGHSFQEIGGAISNICNTIISPETDFALLMSLWIPELLLFILTITMIFRSIRIHSNSVNIYILLYMIISYSTNYLLCGGRYMCIAIPLFFIFAEFCEKHEWSYKWFVFIGLLFQFVLMCNNLTGNNLVT